MSNIAFVFDFDDTLVDYQGRIMRHMWYLKELVESGKSVYILTARYPHDQKEVQGELASCNIELPLERIICTGHNHHVDELKYNELTKLKQNYEKILFWDNDPNNVRAASRIPGVKAHLVTPDPQWQ